MNQPQRIEYINYRVKKSDEAMEVADLLIRNKKWNAAINRLYYAAYYAVSALLVKAKINTKTHAGIKSQFFLYYVKTGKISTDLGKVFSDLFDWRQKGDYGDFVDFTETEIILIYEPAKLLIEKVKIEIMEN